MKVEQLRVGNLVCYDPKDPVPQTVKGLHNEGIDVYYRKLLGYDEVFGIPLTVEWLIKLGFKCVWSGQGDGETWKHPDASLHIHTHDRSHGYNFYWEYSKDGNTLWNHVGHPSVNMMFVHQLQNLFYTLTGEELTFEL